MAIDRHAKGKSVPLECQPSKTFAECGPLFPFSGTCLVAKQIAGSGNESNPAVNAFAPGVASPKHHSAVCKKNRIGPIQITNKTATTGHQTVGVQ